MLRLAAAGPLAGQRTSYEANDNYRKMGFREKLPDRLIFIKDRVRKQFVKAIYKIVDHVSRLKAGFHVLVLIN